MHVVVLGFVTHLPCCEDDGCELRAVTPLCKEGEREGLDEDGGDKRAKASQFPPEGRGSSEALLWISHRILGELCGMWQGRGKDGGKRGRIGGMLRQKERKKGRGGTVRKGKRGKEMGECRLKRGERI